MTHFSNEAAYTRAHRGLLSKMRHVRHVRHVRHAQKHHAGHSAAVLPHHAPARAKGRLMAAADLRARLIELRRDALERLAALDAIDCGLPTLRRMRRYRRTNEDKRRSVMTLLNDPEWAAWGDR